MATDTTVNQIAHILKGTFAKELESATLDGHPLMDRCRKDTSFSGENKTIPILISGGQGIGGKFSTAQANQGVTSGRKFVIETGSYYGLVTLEDKAIDAARKNVGAFARHKVTETREMLKAMGQDLSSQVWGNGGVPFGQIATGGISGDVVTLENENDVIKFHKGMKVVASTGDGSSDSDTLRTGSATVASVDYSAGTITLDEVADITSLAAADYLFREGSFVGAYATQGVILMTGVAAYCPATTPSGTLWGVTLDNSRLWGVIGPTSGDYAITGSIADRCKKFAAFAHTRYRSTPKDYYLDPIRWEECASELENQGVRIIERKNERGTFGYNGLSFQSPYGECSIMADPHATPNRVTAIDPDHIAICSMESLVKEFKKDGKVMLRKHDAPSYEMRWVSYGQVEVNKPSAHGSFALAA